MAECGKALPVVRPGGSVVGRGTESDRLRHHAGRGGSPSSDTYTVADAWYDIKYNVISLHGDIDITTSPNPTGNVPDGAGNVTDEYGIPGIYGTQARYGWLGAAQRSNDALGGVILMGARLYAPTLGRFLSTDPTYGGNENTYTYPNDPANTFDLNGRAGKGGGGRGPQNKRQTRWAGWDDKELSDLYKDPNTDTATKASIRTEQKVREKRRSNADPSGKRKTSGSKNDFTSLFDAVSNISSTVLSYGAVAVVVIYVAISPTSQMYAGSFSSSSNPYY